MCLEFRLGVPPQACRFVIDRASAAAHEPEPAILVSVATWTAIESLHDPSPRDVANARAPHSGMR